MDLDGSALFHTGLQVEGVKNFLMDHPTRPGYKLVHGSTESPVSGTEYWGTATLQSGSATVTLPDYFEALNKLENRAVFLTPLNDPQPLAVTPVIDGRFTVSGSGECDFYWLVKAERFGGDFEVEPKAEPASGDSSK
jgi:hypothetical protein